MKALALRLALRLAVRHLRKSAQRRLLLADLLS